MSTTRPRRAPARTFAELAARVRAHAAELRRRGYDELAQDLLDDLDGDPPDAENDAYGRMLDPGPLE